VFAFLTDHQVITENHALGLKTVKVPIPTVRTPGQTERLALADACINVRDGAIVDVLFGTGLRRGELAALMLADVAIEAGTVFISTSKNGKSPTAVMDARALSALWDWLAVRPEAGHDMVWCADEGGPLTGHGLRMAVRWISDRAGIVWSSHHSRRSFAISWLAQGGSETELMAVCGW
jgi:site-specific recombinase XerD